MLEIAQITIFLYKTIILKTQFHPASDANTLKRNPCVLLNNLFPRDALLMEKTTESSVKLSLRVVITCDIFGLRNFLIN